MSKHPPTVHVPEDFWRLGPSIAGAIFDTLLAHAVHQRDPDLVSTSDIERLLTDEQVHAVMRTFSPHDLRDVGRALAAMTEIVDDLLGLSDTTTRTEKPQ